MKLFENQIRRLTFFICLFIGLILSLSVLISPTTNSYSNDFSKGIVLYDIETDKRIILDEDDSIGDQSVALSNNNAVWFYDKNDRSIITIYNLSDMDREKIIVDDYITQISTDSNTIIFGCANNYYRYDIDQSELTQLFHDKYNTSVYFSMSNSHLVIKYNAGFHGLKYFHQIKVISLVNNASIFLGNVSFSMENRPIIKNNEIFYTTTDEVTGNNSIKLYNIQSLNSTIYYHGDQKVNTLLLSDKYLAWQLGNDSVYILNRTTGEISITSIGDYDKIYDISSDNNIFVYRYIGKESRDIYLFNVETNKKTRLTDTDSHGEYNPKVRGKYVIWEAYRKGKLSDLGFNTLIPLSSIIIMAVWIRWRTIPHE